MPHNFYYLRFWVTEVFYSHHIVEVDEDDPWAKKRAELVFQGRGVHTNTLLCLSADQSSDLIAEVQRRQAEYQADPHGLFVTAERYVYYERGGEGARRKRAQLCGDAYLIYGVRDEYGEGRLKVHHLERMAETPNL